MAEAGVVASAVGILSFGIQIAQGFLKYYGSWKDYDSDILNLCSSLDSLKRNLVLLSETVQRQITPSMQIATDVKKSINRVHQEMKKLELELGKIHETESPKIGVRATIRRHVLRAYYPFKEETITKIQRVISEARANLNLILHVLQMHVDGISEIRDNTNLIVRWQNDQQTESMLDWLSSVNFWQHQADVCKQRQADTGQWLLDHQDFLSWAIGIKKQVWCLGGPGVGKTVLASAVVEFLERDLPSQSTGLAFIYCKHKDYLSQSLEYFIGAIVRQLIERRNCVPTEAQALYKRHIGKHIKPTYAEYMDLLQSLAKEYTEVYVVIDALDECIDKGGEIIWSDLLHKLERSIANLRLLFTSRHVDDSTGILKRSTRIEIRASQSDLELFIRAQAGSKPLLSHFCRENHNLENEIVHAVASKADGMFLAARLHVDSLASKTNLRAIKKALHALPATLDDSYDQAMERIKQQSTKILALRALSWIVYAVRSLQVIELQHAIAVDELEPGDRAIPDDCLTDQSIILNACAGIIKIDEESNVIGLVHKTTQEYFDRTSTKHFPEAQRDISETCLKYLSLDVFREGWCRSSKLYKLRVQDNALFRYSAQNLGKHMPLGAVNDLSDLILKVFLDEYIMLSVAQMLYASTRLVSFMPPIVKNPWRLHYAAFLGLVEIIKLLLSRAKVNVNLRDHHGRTPLSIAAWRGYADAATIILDTDQVGVDSKDFDGHTPLSLAAGSGHGKVMKLLLDTGQVDVDSKDSDGQTPLSWAAEKGHEAIVKLLLDTDKVDVDSKDCYGRTALSWAAENGFEAVVKLLLNTGQVDVNSKDSNGRTPLSWAAISGHEAVVKLLLDTGQVDVNSKDSDDLTPLSWAAENGFEAVVKLLLDTGQVEVDSKHSNGQTLLSWAAGRGHEAVVKLLLDTDQVEVGSKDFNGRIPLSFAANNGHEAVVKLLLNTGQVKVDSKDSHGRTPLSFAAHNGYEAVVKLLLDTGQVDVDSKDSHGQTPLSFAAHNGYEAVVKLLQSYKVL